MPVSAKEQKSIDIRRKYVMGFNQTMINMWKEQITLLGVIDTGRLLNSPMAIRADADGKFSEIYLSQSFLEYGLWQDYGTGKEKPRGNDGKSVTSTRQRRRWFSRAYYRSVMNIREFMADSLGKEFEGILSDALNRKITAIGGNKI